MSSEWQWLKDKEAVEQRKVQGPEQGLQAEQTALLASPIYIGQVQGEENKMYKKRSQNWARASLRIFWVNPPSHTEKAMAPHSSTPAWKIPWMEEPGRLQSMGSRRVGPDSVTSLSLFTFMHWRRKWQPTPMFLPGESQEQGSLMCCHLWGHTELDTTEVT